MTLSPLPSFMGEEAEAQRDEVTSPGSQGRGLLTSLLSDPGVSSPCTPPLADAQGEVLVNFITLTLGADTPIGQLVAYHSVLSFLGNAGHAARRGDGHRA